MMSNRVEALSPGHNPFGPVDLRRTAALGRAAMDEKATHNLTRQMLAHLFVAGMYNTL